MSAQEATLIAAAIAALSSVVTLFLNARFALLKEQRLLLWQKELDRLLETEELAGQAQELAKSYSGPEVLKEEFPPLHDQLRQRAGRLGRYPELVQALRDLNHACAGTVSEKIESGISDEWQRKISPAFEAFLSECDKITQRKTT